MKRRDDFFLPPPQGGGEQSGKSASAILRMKRRAFLTLLGGAAAAWPFASPVFAETAKPRKIGWLKIQDKNHTPGQLKAFMEGLRALGHVEGRTFLLETRFADGDISRLSALAEDLVRGGVDVILATSQPSIEACRKITQSIPIVGRMIDDPVYAGMAQSLARPGGNITGVYSLVEEMSAKRLELLQQAVPGLRRVGVLLTLGRGTTSYWLAETEKAARQLGLDIHIMNVASAEDIDRTFAQAAEQGVNGVIVLRNYTVVTHDRLVIELSNRYRMPGMFDAREFADAGGFMSYGPNLDVIYRRLASYADKILKGTKPGELPIEQPTKFELVLNLRTAKALGISPPALALVSADEVIE